MRRWIGRLRVSLAALGFACLAALPCASETATGTIDGRVVDESGQGVPAVSVSVEGAALREPLLATTDADGRFHLEGLATANYKLSCRLGEEQRPRVSRMVFVEARGVRKLELSLKPSFLDEVTVTATREEQLKREVAAAVDTVSRETVEKINPTHPSQVMNLVPGVWVNATSGEGHMTAIRQPLNGSPVYLYLEDGVPTRSTGFFNHNAMYEINVPASDGIEVTKGPGSALYGSDAVGGVVNVLTRSGFGRTGLEAKTEAGGHGWWRGLLAGNVSGGKNAVRGDLNLTHTDGWRDGTAFDRQSGTLRWDHVPGAGWLIKALATYSKIDQQTAGGSTISEADFLAIPTRNLTPISFRNVEALRISAEIRREAGLASWSLIPYFRYDTMDMLANWTLNFDPTVSDTSNYSYGMLGKYRRNFARLRAQLVTGVDLDLSPGGRLEDQIRPQTTTTIDGRRIFTSSTPGPTVYDYDARFLGVSPYMQWALSPTSKLRVEAGLRFDHFGYLYDDKLTTPATTRHRRPADATRSYDHLSPKLGLTYALGQRASAFASYRHAFRAPSEGQLFRQGTALNTIDLEPVKAENYEVGLRVAPVQRLTLEATVYRLDKRDDILSYRNPLDGATQAVNAGATRHQGVEIGLKASPTPWLSIAGAYSHARHTYEDWVVDPKARVDFSGKEQETAPRDIANLLVSLSPAGKATVSAELFRLGPYWMDAANTQRYKGHTLLNLRAQVPLVRGVKLYGRLMNVTDARNAESASYTIQRGREFAPGLPRTAYAGIELDWRR